MERASDQTTPPPRSSIMDLFNGIIQDLKSLMQQEAQLLRHEVKLEMSKVGRAVSGFGIGAALAGVGGLFLLLMLVHGLPEWTGLPLWASYGLIGLALAAIGLICIVKARALAGSVEAIPQRTIFSMKENIQWIKENMTLRKI
jgi:Putative Actinobacterial Holin-X, holin superfamily III